MRKKKKGGGEGNSRNVPLIIQKNDRQKSRRSCINGTMSGETKFVCQRREFRLVVPADGSNEIPRRLKSCQLLSVSLSLFLLLTSSLLLILLPHFPLAIASTSPGNFASQNFARYVPKGNHPLSLARQRKARESYTVYQVGKLLTTKNFLLRILSLSLSLYYQKREETILERSLLFWKIKESCSGSGKDDI